MEPGAFFYTLRFTYIRWQKRNLRNGGFSLTAILVENKRIKGKPVQRHIAYLGSIKKMNWVKSDFAHRRDRATRGVFWKGITKCLDELHIAGRKKIEVAIAKKVPRLTRREFAMWQRRCQELGLPVPRLR